VRRAFSVVAIIVSATTFAAGTSRGDVVSWQGGPGNWTDANWAPHAPGASDTVLITATGPSYTVTLNTSPTIAKLTLGASSGATTQTLSASSRTLTVSGAVDLNAKGTLTFSSSTISATALTSAGTMNLTNPTLSGVSQVTNNGTLNLTRTGSATIAVPIHNAGTMTVTATTGTPTLTCGTGLANAGTLHSIGAVTVPTLHVTAGALTNTGTLSTLNGYFDLDARLDNQGTISTFYTLELTKASVTHTNTGTISITHPSLPFQVSAGTFNPDGGTFSGPGVLVISGATLGGTSVTTQVKTTLTNAPVTCTSLTNAAGVTLAINRTSGSATIAAPIHNAGTMTVNATPGTLTLSGAFTTASGSSLTLASSSTLSLAGNVTSNGALALNGSADLVVGGTLTIASGTTCDIDDGATLTCGTGLANAGTLHSIGAVTVPTLHVTAGALTNTGALSTLNGYFDLDARLDNQGTISTFYTLELIKASVTHTNTGTISITHPSLPFQVSAGAFQNLSSGVIKGPGTLNVGSAGVTFTNAGTLAPGLSPGTLTVTGRPHFAPGGRLAIELGGKTAGNFDRLAVGGTSPSASDTVILAGGILDLSVINGYLPAIDDSIAVLTAGQLPDTFATVLGRTAPNGKYFNVHYKPGLTPKRIDLIVGDPPPDNGPTAQNDNLTVPEDGSALIAVRANDTDLDGDSLTIASVTNPPHGAASDSAGLIRYTPDANYFGADAFDYVIDDGRGARDTASVLVTVVPVNDPPAFESPTPPNLTTYSVVQGTPVSFTVQARDPDAIGTTTLTATGIPSGASLAPPLPANGNPVSSLFSWTPTGAQLGLHDLAFTATDDSATIATTTVRVLVTPVGAGTGCGPGHHWIATCSPGQDSRGSGALVGIDFDLDNLADQSFVLTGPVTVQRSAPLDSSVFFPGTGSPSGHPDVIDTEILSMSLTGGGASLVAGAGLGFGGVLGASRGTILEQAANDSLADSFFDVFFEVTTQAGRLYNHAPLHVTNVIDRVPPGGRYDHPNGVVALYDDPVGGNHVANLVSARHIVEAPPAACGQPHWMDVALGGVDLPNSEADVGLDLDNDLSLDVSVRLRGPVTVMRSAPLDQSVNFPGQGSANSHLDVIDTEILDMALTGSGITLRAGAGHGAGAAIQGSKGTIVEQPSDPTHADSFFDVFFEVALPGNTYAYNQTPLRVASVIDCVPPRGGYVHPDQVIPLYDSPIPGQGSLVANLVSARHTVGPTDPGPDCRVTGPGTVCVATSHVHGVTSNITPTSYTWSVTGNGTLTGPTNLDHVTILAAPTAGTYTVQVILSDGAATDTCEMVVTVTTSGCGPVAVNGALAIDRFDLGPAIPNPTTGTARVEFMVPRASDIDISVHDLQGRRVARLATGRFQPGSYRALWNGRIEQRRAPAGLYFIRLTTPDRTFVRRVVIVH
jgi:hypothetical protein